MKIISIGEILWDVFENVEHLGGAAFNFAAHARRLGHEVLFISAVGADARGQRALDRVKELGLSSEFVRRVTSQPTGVATVQLHSAGQPEFTIHRPAAYDCLSLTDRDFKRMAEFQADWIYFGTLHQMNNRARRATRKLLNSNPTAWRLYDVNLRTNSYTPALVFELLHLTDVAKLNEVEVEALGRMYGRSYDTLEAFCRSSAEEFGWQAVCVTRGDRGCAILADGSYVEVRGYPAEVADTVGAGDAFAAAFLHGLQQGWMPVEIGDFANRVGALVVSREGAIPPWTPEECCTEAAKGGRSA